ncbi:hypothetical protein B0T10DRAFT_491236 [Thelonectria olida]|uniref:DUF7371 domain-containing protein n=1 Tax=Thelonectria olida TaxID=1576542 RepID=A0A9P8W042_9HYPO|nr:hypothetical protein B0T10DRAFT_491236 [Thelonectria olida]
MATVAVPAGPEPGKRVIRRQEGLNPFFGAWANSSSSSSPVDMPTLSLDPSPTPGSETSHPTVCPNASGVNLAVDFDSAKPGPLFNPVEDIWFSEGFHISPSGQHPQPFLPSSGNQVVEFVPPALSNTAFSGSGDVAEIGVGPHASSPCFRFDFFGASLGCETQGNEEWCEFEISAYRYNDDLSGEESIAWSEVKQVLACPTFFEGGYELTPIELEGYNDLSSVLITVRVGLELRTWWGDDFRVGWTDNSCIASACRSDVPSTRVKRETVASALRRGLYKWSRDGLERFDEEEVWNSVLDE